MDGSKKHFFGGKAHESLCVLALRTQYTQTYGPLLVESACPVQLKAKQGAVRVCGPPLASEMTVANEPRPRPLPFP